MCWGPAGDKLGGLEGSCLLEFPIRTCLLASGRAMQEGVGIETVGGVWAWWGMNDDRARRGHREVLDKSGWVFAPHITTSPPCTGRAGVHAPAGQYPASTPIPTPPRLHPTARDRTKVVAMYLSVLVPVTVQTAVAASGASSLAGVHALGHCWGDGVILQRPRNRQGSPCLAIDRV